MIAVIIVYTMNRMGKVMQFSGTAHYVVPQDLALAVNAAVALQKPLLLKGEPGTGKTRLAQELAAFLQTDLIQWHVKSTTKAQHGLYEYDAVSRLRDGQLGSEKVHDIANYIRPGKLWQAFTAAQRPVLLIDEIDKADIEFPNDLLHELDQMSFYVHETGEQVKAVQRPIVIITSNNEKELPDAFLRRCFFHFIRFPDADTLQQIIHAHFPDVASELVGTALQAFFQLRDIPGVKKKPSTSELLDWLQLLLLEPAAATALQAQVASSVSSSATSSASTATLPLWQLPWLGALLKNEQDVALLDLLRQRQRR